MRKILIVASVILTLCACSKISLTPEGRAKNLIKEHLKEHLGNPKSYDPIGFSELFIEPEDNWAYMIHYFRAENEYGAIVKHAYCYDLDGDITRVEAFTEITDEWVSLMQRLIQLAEDPMAEWVINELSEQGFL